MPLLGGIFSRKNKSATRDNTGATSKASIDSELPSPTNSYVTPDKFIPSSPNGRSDAPPRLPPVNSSAVSVGTTTSPSHSNGRLRLFGRKKSSPTNPVTPASPPADNIEKGMPPQPAYLDRHSTGAASDDSVSTRRLRPPPSKSAIFAAYGDPHGALSTRSLPSEPYVSSTSQNPPVPPKPSNPKKPSIFPWSKPSTSPHSPSFGQTLTPVSTTQTSPAQDSEGAFNLKSFRHVLPSSPPNTSNASLTTPIPRPRGASTTSESSQRISVAAFREAQSRRSQTGSPVPSFRSPSPLPSASRSSPQIQQISVAGIPNRRSTYASESDETESNSEAESDNDNTLQPGLSSNRPGRRFAGKQRAKSEVGHGVNSEASAKREFGNLPSPHARKSTGRTLESQGNSSPSNDMITGGSGNHLNVPPSRSPSALGQYRQRASVSTSALSPTAAAKRASILSAANSSPSNLNSPIDPGADTLTNYKRISRHVRDSSTYSNPDTPNLSSSSFIPPTSCNTSINNQSPIVASPTSDVPPSTVSTSKLQTMLKPSDSDSDGSSDSEDDAPLASLVAPRRPGSALSSYSNSSNPNIRSRHPSPALRANNKPLIDISEVISSTRKPTMNSSLSQDGFTGGATLLAQGIKKQSSNGTTKHDGVGSYGKSGQGSDARSVISLDMKSIFSQDLMATESETSPLTSKSPPVGFVSPPSSPAKEVQAFTFLDARKEHSVVAEVKRDVLMERLSKVAKVPVPATTPILNEKGKGVAVNGAEVDSLEHVTTASQPLEKPEGRRVSFGNEQKPIATALRKEHFGSSKDVQPIRLSDNNQVQPAVRHRRMSSDVVSTSTLRPGSPDEDLAKMLGGGIRLISKNGNPESEEETETETESESESEEDAVTTNDKNQAKNLQGGKEPDRIAPIPIKERAPPPSFSVTSRPPIARNTATVEPTSFTSTPSTGAVTTRSLQVRQRSSTLIPSSTSSSSISASHSSVSSSSRPPSGVNMMYSNMSAGNDKSSSPASLSQANADRASALRSTNVNVNQRQRSSTMLPMMPVPSQSPGILNKAPPKPPFATRRDSPASSTGDSSSGRAPLTPKDGSEIGVGVTDKDRPRGRDMSSRHVKQRSVVFEENISDGKSKEVADRGSADEDRRRERRRSEAKAAIELGNVINGRGPIVDDDDDDIPINQSVNSLMGMNPMGSPMSMQMGFGGAPPGWGNMNMWQQPMQGNSPMLSPAQFIVPPPTDPNFFAAHQQAMMIAKQAYQVAVAQQAMAAAADEWERGSAVGGFGGGSVYGGSVASSPAYGMGMGVNMGMMGMQGIGNGWSTGSAIFPPSTRSMYGGFGSSRSEYGGASGGGNQWSSSRSSYGEHFGPSSTARRSGYRDSGYFPPVPPIPQQQQNTQSKSSPRSRTASQPATPRRKPPPSSWKPGM